MAVVHEVGEPVNDGERQALRLLRDGLPESWQVVGNFTLQQGGRSFECDAVALGPDGWGYLIEVKAWEGAIRGNDAQWELPALVGDQATYRNNPVPLTEQKARVLATVLREDAPELKRLFIQPLLVLVSETPAELEGRCAAHTILAAEMVSRVLEDPRPSGYRKKEPPEGLADRAAETLLRSTTPLQPENVVGNWRLVEEMQVGTFWEVWSAVPCLGGDHARPMRLKRYRIDTLLTGESRETQRSRARRDLEALERLAGADGAVQVSAIEDVDGSLLVVTEWPKGESLASLLTRPLSPDAAEEIFEALASAVASVHRVGIVHRNLTPDCAHLLRDGRVVLTDFDYARLPSTSTGTIARDIGEELTPTYAAPEVRLDPAAASKASDVWSTARIGLALFGLANDAPADASVVPDSWRPVFERALEDDRAERYADAELLSDELFGEQEPLTLFDGFEPNDVLDDRWVVRAAAIETGGIARVYPVHDTFTGKDFAAKFVRDEYAHLFDASEEYRLLYHVPDHPGLVKPEFPLSLGRYRRGEKQYRRRANFLVTRWVDGVRLDHLLQERLPAVRCIELTLALAEAVRHLHAHNLVHRDLKPQNVIVDGRTGQPRLVDFNVSGALDAVDRTETGTPPYRPPDHDSTGWGVGSDVYALAMTLCELLAGGLLRPSPRSWIDGPLGPTDPLLPILDRATSATASERYGSVDELRDDLQAALEVIRRPPKFVDDAPFPTAPADELDRPNWNPYQSRLVSLFSQSTTTNAGTRGLDDFARWAYVATRVDTELFPDIVGGRYRLVMITGNAGDGKTAFIQTLEERLRDAGAPFVPRSTGNGGTVEHHGRRFVTNWDGSQDEGATDNDDVLASFFDVFGGDAPVPPEDETRIIAINEGRLLDFLAERRDAFPWLKDRILALFTDEIPPPESWLCVVNLNLRALTLPREDGDSLVGRLLGRFADERLWEPCAGCAAAEHCYARANAEVLRDPVLGERAAERIRQTVDLVRLRRRLHITMRDLRSALAYTVAGNRTCDEIVGMVENNDRDGLLAGHVYNSLFAASDKLGAPARSPEAEADRMLKVIGTLDVAKTAGPEDDARLWTMGPGALRPDPDSVRRTDRVLLEDLRERLPQTSPAAGDRRARADIRLLQASLRRKLFLEREEPEWIQMLPYRRLDSFMRQLVATTEADRDEVVRAVSNSEGLFNATFADTLAVRLTAGSDSPERSFVLHRASRFALAPLDRSAVAAYVEYSPDTLRLGTHDDPALRLDIDLDLYETLTRILDGFTPSREELRGAWLNLRVFKDQLASAGAEELLLTGGERAFYKLLRASGDAAISVERVA